MKFENVQSHAVAHKNSLERDLRLLRVVFDASKVKLKNYLMQIKRVSELSQDDLNHKVSIDIVFDQKESGILTDFYGAMDSDTHAVIAVELDENLTFYLSPNSEIEIH
jgi:hypothetical protein